MAEALNVELLLVLCSPAVLPAYNVFAASPIHVATAADDDDDDDDAVFDPLARGLAAKDDAFLRSPPVSIDSDVAAA